VQGVGCIVQGRAKVPGLYSGTRGMLSYSGTEEFRGVAGQGHQGVWGVPSHTLTHPALGFPGEGVGVGGTAWHTLAQSGTPLG